MLGIRTQKGQLGSAPLTDEETGVQRVDGTFQGYRAQRQSVAVYLHLFSDFKLREEPYSDPIKHLHIFF